MNDNVKSGKKVVILVAIIFSIIIVSIGATTAFFSQGDSQTTGNIVTVDELSLEYNDDTNNYMRQGLIPSSKENAITAYNREEDKKCLDMNDYSTCSIYRFSVKNTSEVPQLLRMSLHPTANSYKNLKFMLYEVAEEGNILIKDKTDLIQYSVDPITISEAYTLGIDNEDNEKTFEVVFYIEAKDYDQTEEDAGKQFGAGIRIDSITSGKYIAEGFGENCWETNPKDRTKLVKFNGINMDESVVDDIDPMCSSYVSKDDNGYYSINIPSNVGGQEITTLGRSLFNAFVDFNDDDEPYIFNKYVYINEITIEDGIKETENPGENFVGTFMLVGFGINDENYNLNIHLPDTLKRIGDFSFISTAISTITIPKNVEEIGVGSFGDEFGINNLDLELVVFEGGEDGSSKLHTIGYAAFGGRSLTSVVIPQSVKIIGDSAFNSNNLSSLNIPSGVKLIGESAFSDNENLTELTFEGALDGTSKLETIEYEAFERCNLTYETNTNPLILPPNITTMEEYVFDSNDNLKYIYFAGDTTGFGNSWNGNATILKELVND